MFLSTIQTLPFEGHNVAYQFKGFDQSKSVCEYEVNLSTNEKNNVEYQDYLKVRVTMLHVVEKVWT